jgi:hypothetical protein
MMHRPLIDRIRRRLRRDVLSPLDARLVQPYRRWRNAIRDFRPVFVAGVMGSGTSLLALELGQRFECGAVIYESAHEISPRSFLYSPGPHAFASVGEFFTGIRPDPGWSEAEGRAALLDLYRSKARRSGVVAVDKGPNTNLVRAEFLARCFPQALFIVILRDPVVTIEGLRRKWPLFAAEELEASIRFYRKTHERFVEAVCRFPERVISVDYEAIVARPDESLGAIARAVGLEPARRSPRLAPSANVEGQGIRNVRRGRIGIVTDANQRAYARLAPKVVRKIRDEVGPLTDRIHGLYRSVRFAGLEDAARDGRQADDLGIGGGS